MDAIKGLEYKILMKSGPAAGMPFVEFKGTKKQLLKLLPKLVVT